MPHEQSGLQGDQAQGVVGLHSHGVGVFAAQPLARLRVQTRGHVDGQYLGRAVVDGLHACPNVGG